MKFSNDGVWDTEIWEPFSPEINWTLSSGDGSKTIYYKIIDVAGLVTTYGDSIYLDMTKPLANAGENQIVNMGENVYFNAGSSTDNIGIVSYIWDFGDGATGMGVTPAHIYPYTGTYNANLIVTDAAGNSASSSVVITVEAQTSQMDEPSKVSIPTFSPSGGSYSSAQSVVLSCDTSGATIRYTTDGLEPSSTSTAYSAPITVSMTTTINAKAFKTGMTESDTATATYTITTPAPTSSPTPSPSPTQQPTPSPAPEERQLFLYAIEVIAGLAAIGAAIFLLKKKR